MKVAHFEVRPYRLGLAKPLVLRAGELRTRDGALVRVISESGAEGWGDCAPLPSFSPESLDQAMQDLNACLDSVKGAEIRSFDELAAWAQSIGGVCSSARFAAESALASAAAAEAGESLAGWLLGTHSDICLVCALAAGPPDTWAEAAYWASADKFRVLKIKVGRAAMRREISAIFEAVSAAPTLRFRLDANRAWTAETALSFAREISTAPVDYLEEPFSGAFQPPDGWPGEIRLAQDESLWTDGDPAPPTPPVAAWILKPTLAGGLIRAVRLALRAKRAGCEAVWSSAYESGVGIRILGEIGGALGGFAGLDTLRALQRDLLEPPLSFVDGALDLRAARRSVVDW
ncbi:MAG: o-succinylbenzoate synthase [Kiritimatiellae bacterium]|nr:o-succinylbenzoate synthase [Kiritimatiellia bacterium]MDW8459261.1 o-succinylbenzoate synthase [Verrucomicrobiota bacterium]